MSQEVRRNEHTRKPTVYKIPGMDAVKVRQDVEYGSSDAGQQIIDVYYPPDPQPGGKIPAVVFVLGYPDPGFQARLGCRQKEMESYISWARLTAISGMAAILYTNREPAADVHAVLRHVRENSDSLGIDPDRIGVWACSGNVPLALSVLMGGEGNPVRCAVLCYGLMLDLDGFTRVADAAKQWGFANPCAGKSVGDLRQDTPIFIARAGQDQTPGLNESLERFVSKALAVNLPITLMNHATGPHAFDILDDSQASREVIRRILEFMRFHLTQKV